VRVRIGRFVEGEMVVMVSADMLIRLDYSVAFVQVGGRAVGEKGNSPYIERYLRALSMLEGCLVTLSGGAPPLVAGSTNSWIVSVERGLISTYIPRPSMTRNLSGMALIMVRLC
jgi:hypothetical protein